MSDSTLKRTCVINPATDRAVKIDGKIGQRVVERRRAQKEAKAKGQPVAKPKVKTETPPPPKPAPKPTPKPAPKAPAKKAPAKKAPPKPKPAPPTPAPVLDTPLPDIKDVDDTPFIDEPTTASGKYNLPNRVKFITDVKRLVKDIKDGDCVEPKKFGKDDGYSVRNIINLEKRIGTESAYGVIYLTKIAGASDNYKIASKLFNDSTGNKKEIKVMDYLTTEILLKQKSRHFLALYNKSLCKDKALKAKLRLLSINELAHGDLKGLVNTKNVMGNDAQVVNMFLQVMISIATFQKATTLHHADCHYGNFLYQKNIEKGHYHYKCDGEDYYLPASDYTMMIYDFGLSKNYNKDLGGGRSVIVDYARIIHAFINGNDGGWCDGNHISKNISTKMNTIKRDFLTKYTTDEPDKTPTKIIKYLNTTFPNVFTKLRPPNIINTVPFEI